MKVNSPFTGKASGKLGNMVVATAGGQTIAREYNPNVTNPNTSAQQTTRAKFKLLSQLSAVMAPVIAIRKEGLVSARNQFTKQNFPTATYAAGVASIDLNSVQLTKSQRAFAGFNADRSSGTAIAVQLDANSAASLSRVVYVVYIKNDAGELVLHDSKVCETAGVDGLFADTLSYSDKEVVVYAYGINDLDASITSKFGNLAAPTAELVAQLLVSNSENMSSVALTKTAGLTMAAGTNSADSAEMVDPNKTIIRTIIDPAGGGSATGAGTYDKGQQVTLVATPAEGYDFVGWFHGNAMLTYNPTYQFIAGTIHDFRAKFQRQGASNFDQVVVGDTNFDRNITVIDMDTMSGVSGEYNGEGSNLVAAFVTGNPTVGSTIDIQVLPHGNVNGTTKIFQFGNGGLTEGTYKLVVGTLSGNNLTVTDVYGYTCTVQGGGN